MVPNVAKVTVLSSEDRKDFSDSQISHLLAIFDGIWYVSWPPSAFLRVHEGGFIFDEQSRQTFCHGVEMRWWGRKKSEVTNRLAAPILKGGKMYQDLHGQIMP